MTNDIRRWMTLCEAAQEKPLDRIRKKSSASPPDTQAFKRWFGASKVVDRQGKPLVCYHGTHQNFTAFDNSVGHTGLIFFSANPRMAGGYSATIQNGEGGNIIPVYLRILKPYDYRVEDNVTIAHRFYSAYGGIDDNDARQIRIALYGKPNIEDDDNPEINSDFLELDEFITALDRGEYPALEVFDFLKFLQSRGYDGIVTHEVRAINYGIFNPNQAKSIFAKDFNSDSEQLSESETWNDKTVVSTLGEYRIVVDSLKNASYISVWTADNKKIGALMTTSSGYHAVRGDKWLRIYGVSLVKTDRGKGLGLMMYKTLLQYMGDEYSGIATSLPDITNNKQIPAIYHRLGAKKIDDYWVIPKSTFNSDSEHLSESYSPMYVFHGTPKDNLESIRKNGLIPGFPNLRDKNIFFAKEYDTALRLYAHDGYVLRIKTNDLPEGHYDSVAGIFWTPQPIPPEVLEVKINGDWKPLKHLTESVDSLVLYHGGDDKIKNFKMEYASEGFLFFTALPRIARAYGPEITFVRVSPKNIFYTTPREWGDGGNKTDPDLLRASGYDLVIIKGGPDEPRGFKADIYAVLDPSIIQIIQ